MNSDDFRAIVHAEIAPLRDHILRIDHHLTGNGTPERGVIVRLDRLEQSHQNGRWFTRALITTTLGAVVASIAAVFK